MRPSHLKWSNFELPPLEENDYGLKWLPGTHQITKELMCLKRHRMKARVTRQMRTPLIHFLNIQRMLFDGYIDLFKKTPKGIIWNNWYLDISEICCEFDNCTLTGPASANKTFCVSSFDLTMWLMAPQETLVMVSTTSGAGSERRIWGDIKDMHRAARWEECGIEPIGEVVDYKQAIVYDPGKQLGGAEKNNRDYRNGISVIPIPTDSSGDSALATIIGSKNKFVYWTLDEMPNMNPGVTRPNGNLIQNDYYMFIGIGNAKDVNDPHGKDCMPPGGIEDIDPDTDRRWTAANGRKVLFLHGEDSPNNHPYIDQSKIRQGADYPYPYASNPYNTNATAFEYGNGNVEEGKKTTDYYRFAIGFWPPLTVKRSLYTTNLFKSHGAFDKCPPLVGGTRAFAGGDFAFSVGGDKNSCCIAVFGYDGNGNKFIDCSQDNVAIHSKANSAADFNRQIAKGFVDALRKGKVDAQDFGGDTGNDSAIIFNEMCKIAGTNDFKAISSIGNASNQKKYANKVTEMYFKVRDLVRTGLLRGIDRKRAFISQLTERQYDSLSAGKKVIEPKKNMKKRIGRSPDDSDAWIYCMWMIIQSGLVDGELEMVRLIKTPEEQEDEEEEMKRASIRLYEPSQLTDEEYSDDDFGSDNDFMDYSGM